MEEITSNSNIVVIATLIIAVLSMFFTGWATIHMVRKSVQDDKNSLDEWKKNRETTDTEQSKDIKSNADKIRDESIKLQNEIKKREELDERMSKEIASIKEIIQNNKDNLKEELIKAINSLQPLLKEQEKSILDNIKTLLKYEKDLNDKEIQSIWNELEKKTTKRVRK